MYIIVGFRSNVVEQSLQLIHLTWMKLSPCWSIISCFPLPQSLVAIMILCFLHCITLAPLLKMNWRYTWGVISDSLFYSVGLHVCLYARTTLFWVMYFCSNLWNQEVWSLQLCSSFSRLCWAFGVPLKSMWILQWIFLYLQK